MRILSRYILREILSHAAIGTLVLTFVLFMRDLSKLLELVVRASAPLPSVAEIFFLTVPAALNLTLPMGVLIGILLGLSRMAADSEIIAMRACGLGAWSFLKVIGSFALVATLLALGNNLWLAPRSAAALDRLQDRLKTSQVSYEVQPRVFYEGFRNSILYVQDAKSAVGGAVWKGIFLADLSNPATPRITLAREGIMLADNPQTLHLHLSQGAQHESDVRDPQRYSISTFTESDIPITVSSLDAQPAREQIPVAETPTFALPELAAKAAPEPGRWLLIEFYRRFALPIACFVLALVGLPLGLATRKGGKSAGFVVAIFLVFLYYTISLIGISLARNGWVGPLLGVGAANLLFLAWGLFLLWRAERRPIDLGFLRTGLVQFERWLMRKPVSAAASGAPAKSPRRWIAGFPMILDNYILRSFLQNLGTVVGAFLVLLLVFTFFELLGDMLRNHVSATVMLGYLWNVIPFFLYKTLHLSVLLAVLITFGSMTRNNEITAMKATGTSIYRAVAPVFVICLSLSAGLFLFDQYYLPQANRTQDALRNQIKGKPPQTYLRPDRKWIFGQQNTIYYYEFFDADKNEFGRVSAFQFDPGRFDIVRRVYAERARWSNDLKKWVFERGWNRDLRGSAIENFTTFEVATFDDLNDPPAYFKKEVIQSSEMNYAELERYIADLQQSGFDVVRLRLQLQEKLSIPLVVVLMALLGTPFALSAGRRGTLAGVAIAIAIFVVYTVVSGVFDAMGGLSQLPAALAAWAPDIIFAFTGGYLLLKTPT